MSFTPPSLSYFLCFARARGIGPMRLRKLIAHFGGLEFAWRANAFDLARAGLDSKSTDRVLALCHETGPASAWRKHACAVLGRSGLSGAVVANR
jgi:predicted Rossmann fold nucleotide-binding protein DprA/Smf involved in DNA uptake